MAIQRQPKKLFFAFRVLSANEQDFLCSLSPSILVWLVFRFSTLTQLGIFCLPSSTTCGGDFEKTRNRNWVRFSFENGSEIGGNNLFFARCDVLRLSSGRRFLRRRDATLSSGNPSASRWSHHAVCLRGTYYSTSWKYRTTISHSFLWLETGLLEKSSSLE